MYVDLRGKVAAGVHLVVHGKRRVLAVAQVVGGICEVYAVRYFLLVVAAGVHVLAFFAVHDCRAGILAERKLAFCSHFGIAEHGESHELVVLACFGVGKDFSHHGVVLATEHESVVVGSLTRQHGKRLGVYDKELVPAPCFGADIFGSEVVVLGSVRSQRKHFLVMKRFCCHIFSSYSSVRTVFTILATKIRISRE